MPNKRSDICIVTLYDAGFRSLGDLAWLSIERYGKDHSMDVIRFTEAMSDRPRAWDKILCIKKMLDAGYSYVLWIDADAVIMKNAPDIRTLISADDDASLDSSGQQRGGAHDFFMARHAIDRVVDGEADKGFGPNTGVFLVRNSPTARKALDDIWNMDQYMNHVWWEQAAFLDYFGLIDDLPPSEKKLFAAHSGSGHDDSFGGIAMQAHDPSVIKWIDDKWNFIPQLMRRSGSDARTGKARNWREAAIRHHASVARYRRLRGMIVDSLRNGDLNFNTPKNAFAMIKYLIILVPISIRHAASHILSSNSS